MKKFAAVTLALMLTLALLPGLPAQAAPEDWQGKTLSDFSAETIDGQKFTLSESLKTHDLVLINLWATWCGPCRYEFPFLEAAWERYGSRVDVIALSVENGDTMSVLRSFAQENSLTFPIGRDDNNLFGTIGGSAIPTTLIVNRDRTVVAVEIGAQSSVEAFTGLFDRLLSEIPAPAVADRCVLCFRGPDGRPIPGVTVGFCNGEYTPVDTDSEGRVTFDGAPSDYHVHLLAVPAGYTRPWEELYISGDRFDLTVTLYPD